MASVGIIALLVIIGLSCVADASSKVFPVWVEGNDDGFAPSKRTRHDVIQDSKGDLWLFGGFNITLYDSGDPQNELYKMTVRNNYTWALVDTSASAEVPSPRGEFCWSIDEDDNIYLFGGTSTTSFNADKPVFGDLWMFSTSSLTWTLLRNSSAKNFEGAGTESTHPGPRVLTTCWFNDDTKEFWLYGGYFYFSFFGDVWAYGVDTGIWTWRSGKPDSDFYADSDVQIGVPYVDKMPGSSGQASATTDLDGNVWIYGGWMVSNYGNQLWRFKMSTSQWTFFGGNFTTGSLETARFYGRYDQIGTFSAGNHPPANLYGALVYAGNGMLAFVTSSFLATGLYNSQQLWHYNITTNQWALMYAVTGSTDLPVNRGTFQKMDPTANIGTRIHWGRSRTLGNIWVTRGIEIASDYVSTADTLVFPMSICSTDLAPACPTDKKCEDRLGYTECVCSNGTLEDGKTCAPGSGPSATPKSNAPARTPNSIVGRMGDIALVCVALLLVL